MPNDFYYYYFTQILHRMKEKFTNPKLNNKSKYWYVHFRYEGVQFRETNGLNKIEDLKVRESEYNDLCKIILADLKKGWNPNLSIGKEDKNEMNFSEALQFSLLKKIEDVSKETMCSYSGTVRFLEAASKKINLEEIKIVDLTRVHVKLLMNEAKKIRNWTNKAYNTHLLHLKILLYVLVEEDILESNPATRIANKKVDKESSFHRPANESDMETIKKSLFEKDFKFYIFCISVFHTGIRPGELLRVKLGMVDLVNNEFNLPGRTIKNGKEVKLTKNGNARVVPINKYLKEYLLKMDFLKLPKDYYLFGSLKSQGKGRKKKENKMLPDFLPSQYPTIRKTAGDRWRTMVKEDLGISMNLYAMKHYGADKKILAGIDMDSLRELYGHSSKLTTERYANKAKEVYRKDILDNSPDF
jgi:integrase